MKDSKGLVFDIERFAVHDGSGIRTTIFLKGCPLSCKWCQNPEGMAPSQSLVWQRSQCINCRLCESSDSVTWKEDRPHFAKDMDPEEAARLVDLCPGEAIAFNGTWKSPQDLIAELEKDRPFFREQGGVTFSGGEPFLQADFLKDSLQLCKQSGFHTAIETSLSCRLEDLQEAAENLDEIFFDIKILDEKKHKELTGVSNRRILENAAWLLTSRHAPKITVRTPLIPGCTANDENIAAIAGFLARHNPNVRYELLNWNPLASAKYELAEKDWQLPEKLARFDKAQMEHFRKIAREAGVKTVL